MEAQSTPSSPNKISAVDSSPNKVSAVEIDKDLEDEERDVLMPLRREK